jgi:hypothetical protein
MVALIGVIFRAVRYSGPFRLSHTHFDESTLLHGMRQIGNRASSILIKNELILPSRLTRGWRKTSKGLVLDRPVIDPCAPLQSFLFSWEHSPGIAFLGVADRLEMHG